MGGDDLNRFEFYSYYKEEHLQHYYDYALKNPQLQTSDVIWQVNAGLYRPFYEGIEEIKDTSVFPLLVNKYKKLPSHFIPSTLTYFPNSIYQACQNTVEAFLQLQEDARVAGCHLSVVSAYRTFDYQENLYHDYLKKDSMQAVDTYSARAGHSEHQTGYAIDICETDHESDKFEGTKESNWINNHAHEYGFIIRYQKGLSHLTGYRYEPWHITFVGKRVARLMHYYQIGTLEEFMTKFIEPYNQ